MATAFSLIHSGAAPATGRSRQIFAQAAFGQNVGGSHQDAAVVHARSHVQHRRNADRFADFAQRRARLGQRGFRGQQTRLGAGDGGATGLEHQHIALDQLLGQGDVTVIGNHLGIAATHDADHAADAAIDDGIIQRAEGRAEAATQHVEDGLVGEAGHQFHRLIGDVHPALITIRVVVDGFADQVGGLLVAVLHVEFDLLGFAGVGNFRSADQFGVEALGHLRQRRHNALHIDHHDFDGPGEDGQLLLQEVAHDGQSVAHQDFIGGAANPGDVDTLRAFGAGVLQQLFVFAKPRPASPTM